MFLKKGLSFVGQEKKMFVHGCPTITTTLFNQQKGLSEFILNKNKIEKVIQMYCLSEQNI